MRASTALALALFAMPTVSGAASASVIDQIELRLAEVGLDQVNVELGSEWSSATTELHRRTKGCELKAVSLTMRLSRGSNAKLTTAHLDALRLANGRCTRFVLAVAAPHEIALYCSSLATWRPAQTARELRRRIAAIEADGVLLSSQAGRSCRAAYLYELNNTRVVLRSKA